jgi:NADH:ubiquinone oxidoreductase subunit F (NADH-binding)
MSAQLDALRERHPAPPQDRVLLHLGTCGHAVSAPAYGGDVDQRLRSAGSRLPVEASVCDGACWAAPAATVMRGAHRHRFARIDREATLDELGACAAGSCDAEGYAGEGERGVSGRFGRLDGSLGDALAAGAYATLDRALGMERDAILEAIEAGGFTGRGGAHFPVATKWRLTGAHSGTKAIVVNAEEGEPGVFKDRHLLEGDPHRLIEGILIACHTTGATRVYVYINGQARSGRGSFEQALSDADAAGLLDGSAIGGPEGVTIEVRSGAGGYVCGEESVILNSIEGERPVPRYKPPFATDVGVFGLPTVINNAETLAAVTTFLDDPPPPTKLMPLSGDVARPGLYEVPVDGATTWAGVLAMAGANPSQVQALLLGGPSGSFVMPEAFDEPLEMRGLGAGGTVVLAPDADLVAITLDLARYNAQESCGECTPCREGTPRLVELLEDPTANADRISGLIEVMTEASLCQLGGMAGRPVASALESFPELFGGSSR